LPNINADEILNELRTNDLKAKIAQYPALIVVQRAKIRELREVFNNADRSCAVAEAELISEISEEKDSATGKAKYSNAETRQAVLLKRKQVDSTYIKAIEIARDAEQNLNQAEEELDKLEKEFKANLFVSDLVSSEISLYAGIARRDLLRDELDELINKQERLKAVS
jgi:hypothetical protein